MRTVHYACLALALVATVPAFARGAGGAAGGGGAGAGGGAGTGSNPVAAAVIPSPTPHNPPVHLRHVVQQGASCHKAAPLYDRYGRVVALTYGADCYE